MIKKTWKIGEIRNGLPVLPKDQRKKILLLADDLRILTGVGTMSKQIVIGTCHHYNWVQLAGSIKHKDKGKIIDISKSITEEYGIPDASILLYPTDGYGNQELMRAVLSKESPDAILHFTDPRFWDWLDNMEHEIRVHIPIIYYALWDDLPYPKYNRESYRSNDLIMSISKQSENIHKTVLGKYTKNTKVTYVPHGIDPDDYKPVFKGDERYQAFKKRMLGNKEYDFIILYNNRNIRRKMPGDLMISYKMFCDSLPKEKADKTLLIYHTQPIDINGTDLPAMQQQLCDGYNIRFLVQSLSYEDLNYLYNMADVVTNISSAEGFGLASAEAIMAGTPIIATVTGGLQDQMGFVDESGELIKFTVDFPSNSCGRYTKHGEWAFPLWPQLNLVGSPPTPYIYDSRAKISDVVVRLKEVYKLSSDKREEIGLAGREFALKNLSHFIMCNRMMKDIDECIKNFIPQKRFNIYKCGIDIVEKKINGIWNKNTSTWV